MAHLNRWLSIRRFFFLFLAHFGSSTQTLQIFFLTVSLNLSGKAKLQQYCCQCIYLPWWLLIASAFLHSLEFDVMVPIHLEVLSVCKIIHFNERYLCLSVCVCLLLFFSLLFEGMYLCFGFCFNSISVGLVVVVVFVLFQ